jgi:4,5-DOPA dioxygenase extradiol
MFAIQDNAYTRAWQKLGAGLPRPRAILVISAHWTTPGTFVTAMAAPPTIHDFGGFPQALFDVKYPAPGDPALAERICALLAPLDVKPDLKWGLDHGTWAVLVKAYPDADIPVLQLSIDQRQPAQFHVDLGARLTVLRDEGVLIVGSGNVVHNLRTMNWAPKAPAFDWADRFNDFIRTSIANGQVDAVTAYATHPDARMAVPTTEHFLPLLYVLGAARADDSFAFPVDGIDGGSISMLSVTVGA